MIFFDGAGLGLGIALIIVLGLLALLLAGAQILRAFLLPGWRGLLYPAQTALALMALLFGQDLVWLLPLIGLTAIPLTVLTCREDPDLAWFAILGGLATLGYCALAYLTI